MKLLIKHIAFCVIFFLLALFFYSTIGSKLKNHYREYDIAFDPDLEKTNAQNLSEWKNWTDLYAFPVSPAQRPVIAFALPRLEEYLYINKKRRIKYADVKKIKRYPANRLPVVALTISPALFFDEQEGIYTPGKSYYSSGVPGAYPAWWDRFGNYAQRGKAATRSCLVNFYDPISANDTCFPAQVRINGNATRAFAHKSLRLELESALKLKQSWSKQHIFPSKSVVLRNGGNDGVYTLFADYFMQQAASVLRVPVQKGIPVSCFVNTRYWGVYYLLNRYDRSYAAHLLGINKKNVIVYEQGEKKPDKKVIQLFERIDASDPLLDTLIDWENFIDYIFVQAFFMNTDWPQNNVRIIGGKGVKWKFVLCDMDFGMSYTGLQANDQYNMFQRLQQSKTKAGKLFKILLKDQKKMDLLFTRFDQLLKNEFSKERLTEVFDRCYQVLVPEMNDHIKRWGRPESLEQWNIHVQQNRAFVEKRVSYFSLHYREQIEACGHL